MYTGYSKKQLRELRDELKTTHVEEIEMRVELAQLCASEYSRDESIRAERFVMEAQDELAARSCFNRHRAPEAVM